MKKTHLLAIFSTLAIPAIVTAGPSGDGALDHIATQLFLGKSINELNPNNKNTHFGADRSFLTACYKYAAHPTHAGIDIQTVSVAGSDTAEEIFYSLVGGEVTNVTANGTIAVYNKDEDYTVIYLHARESYVTKGDFIGPGHALGIQGNKGLGYASSNISTNEHVHVEVREGKQKLGSCSHEASGVIDPISFLYSKMTGEGLPKLEITSSNISNLVENNTEQELNIYANNLTENTEIQWSFNNGPFAPTRNKATYYGNFLSVKVRVSQAGTWKFRLTDSTRQASSPISIALTNSEDNLYVAKAYLSSQTTTKINNGHYKVVSGTSFAIGASQCYEGTTRKLRSNGKPKLSYYISNRASYRQGDKFLGSDTSTIGTYDRCDTEGHRVRNINYVGTYYVHFVADSDNDYSETNENDNSQSIKVDFVNNSSGEDISLSNVGVYDRRGRVQLSSNTRLNSGEKIYLKARQNYSGYNTRTKKVYLGYYWSKTPSINDANPLAFDISTISSLDKYDPEGARVRVPRVSKSGYYYIVFVADYNSRYQESDEVNNVVSKRVYINK